MAEQRTHDVVNQARSVGDASPSDVSASKTIDSNATGGAVEVNVKATISNEEASRQEPTSNGPPAVQDNPNLQDVPFIKHADEDSESSIAGIGSEFKQVESSNPSRANTPSVDGENRGRQGALDGSGGSDTDTSKPDGLPNGKHHTRSASVKRPTSFKSVSSVTKSFLAKAASGSAAAAKLSGDRSPSNSSLSAASNQPTPRPRLVAKSTGGLRDSLTRSSSAASTHGSGGAPDGSKVWNKNRPVPPPPPKQFTDEELKQQYGIHLATRLQSDDNGKEGKWADIDDDEDDWAPEEIEWNDGTKTSLHTEDHSTPPPAAPDSKVEPEKAAMPAPDPPKSSSSTTKVLKLGGSADTAPKFGGLVLKGAPEKPTLVAKPTPPAPVKSPWAPLPPIDKISPVAIDHRPQESQLRTQREQRENFQDSVHPPHLPPAREIEADDFNRSWRDGYTGNRELFNSQSGRYEPVNDVRRGSLRHEQGFRQPAVLQRPHHHDQSGPAEPSAAFQTSRTTHQDSASWGRRRTSSNVSGGSGVYGRRMSFGRGPDEASADRRRGSQVGTLNTTESAPHPSDRLAEQGSQYLSRGYSPTRTNQHAPWPQHSSPVLHHVAPASPEDAASQTPSQTDDKPQGAVTVTELPQQGAQDPVAVQQKIMKEKRELAMKRRREEEEREEAARRERIRLKMESLGMAPMEGKLAKSKTAQAEEVPQSSEPPHSQHTEAPAHASYAVAISPPADVSAHSKEKEKAVSLNEHLPKPPVPEHSGEVRQYGLMKVHQPQPVRRSMAASESQHYLPQRIGTTTAAAPRAPSPSKVIEPGVTKPVKSDPPTVPSLAPHPQDRPLSSSPQQGSRSGYQDSKEQLWKTKSQGAESYPGWTGSMTTHSVTGSNLWGPPHNDKALGNGTFDRGLSTVAQRHITQPQPVSPPVPGPIGPPPAMRKPLSPSKPITSESEDAQQTISPVGRSLPEQPSPQLVLANSTPVPPLSSSVARPTPIGPPVGPSNRTSQSRASALSAWANLPAQLAREDAEARRRDEEQHSARLEEEARTGVKRDVPQPTFKETWRQVLVDNSSGQRQVVSSTKQANEEHPLKTESKHGTIESAIFPVQPSASSGSGSTPNAVAGGRGSRFFPQGSSTARSTNASLSTFRPGSPPPPESFGHPAYAGDVNRPLVSLPIPKPIVKLPPPAVVPATSVVSTSLPKSSAARQSSESLRVVPQPIASTSTWQDRFNGLFERKPVESKFVQLKPAVPVPPKSYALAVNSASKAPLEVASNRTPATVSLPKKEVDDHASHLAALRVDFGDFVSTKPTEEALLEEREFGSIPIVRVPLMAPRNAWSPAKPPQTRPRSRFQKSIQVQSIEPFLLNIHDKENQSSQGYFISVRLPGESTTKTQIMPRAQGSLREPIRSRNSSAGYKKKPLRAKEGSGNSHVGRSRRPSSQRSTPPTASPKPGYNNSTWGRRVSGVMS